MAEKKAVTTKKGTTKKNSMKGQSYECALCEMEITVDEDCGCEETCDIICCGEPMKEKGKAKPA